MHQDVESTRVLEIEGSTTTVDNTPTYSYNGGDDAQSDGVTITNGFGNTWSNDRSGGYHDFDGGYDDPNPDDNGWDDNSSNFGASDSF